MGAMLVVCVLFEYYESVILTCSPNMFVIFCFAGCLAEQQDVSHLSSRGSGEQQSRVFLTNFIPNDIELQKKAVATMTVSPEDSQYKLCSNIIVLFSD
jgi:hypothetical protein